MADKIGFLSEEAQYIPLTIEEVREAARDLLSGQIFGSWQLPARDQSLIGTIFMPLMFADDLLIKQWERDEVIHAYGHMSNTFARSINGYPIFHAIRQVTLEDANRIINMAKAMHEMFGTMEEPNAS